MQRLRIENKPILALTLVDPPPDSNLEPSKRAGVFNINSNPFTTRPEIDGTFGVVTSTHWIGTAVGMVLLERGGNAFDGAVFQLKHLVPIKGFIGSNRRHYGLTLATEGCPDYLLRGRGSMAPAESVTLGQAR